MRRGNLAYIGLEDSQGPPTASVWWGMSGHQDSVTGLVRRFFEGKAGRGWSSSLSGCGVVATKMHAGDDAGASTSAPLSRLSLAIDACGPAGSGVRDCKSTGLSPG